MNKHYLRSISISLFFLCGLSSFLSAQIPSGYYDSAEGLKGYTLKTALSDIVKENHNVRHYGDLWQLYRDSDAREDGTVYDMYTDCEFIFGPQDEGGNQDGGSGGNVECDKYNREHVLPRNWFGGTISPMNEDAHHIPPVDKFVNAKRANYPFGPVSNVSYTTSNGSKFGSASFSGYSGDVFEVVDQYKGDFARMFLYMAVRYQDEAPSWKSNSSIADDVFDGTTTQVYSDWQLDILIDWHLQDPPDDKERNRNDVIYQYQGNRNPFIDHPEYVMCIWRTLCGDNNPIINLSAEDIDLGTVAINNYPSPVKSYLVSAEGLSAGLMISTTDGFELSVIEDQDFSGSLNFTPNASGEIEETTIYVRYNGSEEETTTISGTIDHVSGEVTASLSVQVNIVDAVDPILQWDAENLGFGLVEFDQSSDIQLINISVSNLEEPLHINANNGFSFAINDEEEFQTSLQMDNQEASSITQLQVRYTNNTNENSFAEGTLDLTSGVLNLSASLSAFNAREGFNPRVNLQEQLGEFVATANETASPSQSFLLTAEDVYLPLLLNTDDGDFTFSLDNESFEPALSLDPIDFMIENREVFVRYEVASPTPGLKSNDIISITHDDEVLAELNMAGSIEDINTTLSFLHAEVDVDWDELPATLVISRDGFINSLLHFQLTIVPLSGFSVSQLSTEPAHSNGLLNLSMAAGDTDTSFTFTLPDSLANASGNFSFRLRLVASSSFSIGENNQVIVQVQPAEEIISALESPVRSKYIIYPNPAGNSLFIKGDRQDVLHYSIYDLHGKQLITKEHLPEEAISLQDFSAGIYILYLHTAQGSEQHKLIKN